MEKATPLFNVDKGVLDGSVNQSLVRIGAGTRVGAILWPWGHVIVVWRFGPNVIDAGHRGDEARRCGARADYGMESMNTHLRRGRTFRGSAASLALVSLAALGGCLGMGAHHPHNAAQAEIGVNGYLWRASLDTLAFMPLQSADPFGGVINTDWYVDPRDPTERFKATVYILDSRLRADGLNVTVFKQVSDGHGGWTPSAVSDQTSTDIENAILTRARELRLSNLRG